MATRPREGVRQTLVVTVCDDGSPVWEYEKDITGYELRDVVRVAGKLAALYMDDGRRGYIVARQFDS